MVKKSEIDGAIKAIESTNSVDAEFYMFCNHCKEVHLFSKESDRECISLKIKEIKEYNEYQRTN